MKLQAKKHPISDCVFAGYNDLPTSPNAIRALVMRHAGDIQSQVKSDLALRLKEGTRFSLTFDEWTSVRNRRYMVVNVHGGGTQPQFWSLGLVRVHGSMPAENCVILLRNKLKSFGLNLDTDIVGVCTDGASVMCKVGKLISTEHQLCLAHGVHLAVHDVLYKRKRNSITVVGSGEGQDDGGNQEVKHTNESDDNHTGVEDVELDFAEPELNKDSDESDNDDVSSSSIGSASGDQFHVEACDAAAELSDQYRHVIEIVRKTVTVFRRSPVKNDSILQKYVKEDHGKEITLLLDCPTRWNSLLSMLSRFSLLRTSIQKAMIDMKTPQMVTDADFMLVDEIIAALEPVALMVQMPSRQDVNLLSAEAALQFCLVTLRKQQYELGKAMAMALHTRVSERYGIHSNILRYLHIGDATSQFSERDMSSLAMRKYMLRLLNRLDCTSSSSASAAASLSVTTTATQQSSDAASVGIGKCSFEWQGNLH